MREKKRFSLPPYVMLMLISIVMSFAIAGVYMGTKDTIEAAALAAQEQARAAVMEGAAYMTELPLAEGAPVDYCYEACDEDGNVIGYVSQITVVGFGGEIEVTVGMDAAAAVTAIEVGGKDFSETSGLGAKTREPAFKDQFRRMSGMLILKQNIDSVTGASISSGAVVSGVNKAVEYMKTLLPEDTLAASAEELPLTEEQIAQLLPGAENLVWMGGGSGIDGWWSAENGYIVRATGFGEGPIAVTMGFDNDRTVAGILIGDENFMETEGRGDGVLADWYKAQFIGRSGPQTYGEGIDAISGATVTSDATLTAVNACMAFDPVSGESAAPVEESASRGPDAVTEASIPEEESGEDASAEQPTGGSAETPYAPDAVSEASIPAEENGPAETPYAPDAISEASIVEVEEAGIVTAPAISGVLLEPDAVTEASVPEEESGEDASAVQPTGEPAETPYAPDAISEASIPAEENGPAETPYAPDAISEASIPAEESGPVETPYMPDAVTEASIPEEEEPAAAPGWAPYAPVIRPAPIPDAVTEASVPEE